MRNPWPFFVRFSLIRARNWEPVLLFAFLSFRNFLTKFGIFYQPSEPVGNRFNRFNTIAGCLYQPWRTPAFLCLVLTHPGSELRTVSFVCFLNHLGTFWPNLGFFTNRFSTIAGSLCQPWGTLAFLCLVLTHPGSELRTVSFFLFPYLVRNFLTKFWIFY